MRKGHRRKTRPGMKLAEKPCWLGTQMPMLKPGDTTEQKKELWIHETNDMMMERCFLQKLGCITWVLLLLIGEARLVYPLHELRLRGFDFYISLQHGNFAPCGEQAVSTVPFWSIFFVKVAVILPLIPLWHLCLPNCPTLSPHRLYFPTR